MSGRWASPISLDPGGPASRAPGDPRPRVGPSADARRRGLANPAGLRRRSGAEAGEPAAGRAGGRGRSLVLESRAGIEVSRARGEALRQRLRSAGGAGPRLEAEGSETGAGALRAGPWWSAPRGIVK